MEPVSRDQYHLQDFRSLGGGRIQVQFVNGQWVEVDFADLIARGNMFANWADDGYLAQGRIGEGAHYLEWPGELDIHADSLWLRGVAIKAPVPA